MGRPSGRRFVVGCWQRSPLGEFADVMVAHPDGTRELLAPTPEVGDYVGSTYEFDRVTVTDVSVQRRAGAWSVQAGPLELDVRFGRWMTLGSPLCLVRGPLVHPAVARLANPCARCLLPGVTTHASAGHAKHEYCVAQDLQAVVSLSGTWAGVPLGGLADVTPTPTFGFSSTPRTPALTTVRTFIDVPGA